MKLYKNYMIYYVFKEWGGILCKVLIVRRRESLEKFDYYQQEEWGGGYKFWSFCDNLIIEYP